MGYYMQTYSEQAQHC